MGSQSIDDCYFYYYSSCTKGKSCPFRHCEAALGTETVCTLWREGCCYRSDCKYRHMESRINRESIPCYWEDKPGGCRKPHCVFMHKKRKIETKSPLEKDTLILPLPMQKKAETSPKMIILEEFLTTNTLSDLQKRIARSEDSFGMTSPSVEPFVVSFDDESDNESVSTPLKIARTEDTTNVKSAARKLALQMADLKKDRDLGIKTLEQIRMEKIHKESEHFYKSMYDAPHLIESNAKLVVDPISHPSAPMDQLYPPMGDFISLSASNTDAKPVIVEKQVAQRNADIESDLRSMLLKKQNWSAIEDSTQVPLKDARNIPDSSQSNLRLLIKREAEAKRKASQAASKQTTNNAKPETKKSSFDFKIKTLDEIRKERERKTEKDVHTILETDTENKDVNIYIDEDCKPSSTTEEPSSKLCSNGNEKPKKKLKINRISNYPSSTNHLTSGKRSSEDSESSGRKIIKLNSPATPAKLVSSLQALEIKPIKIEQKSSSQGLHLLYGERVPSPIDFPHFSIETPPRKFPEHDLESNSKRPTTEISHIIDSTKSEMVDIDNTFPINSEPLSATTEPQRISPCFEKSQPRSLSAENQKTLPPSSSLKSALESNSLCRSIDSKTELCRLLSVDDFDNFLDDTDEGDDSMNATGDEILLEVDEFLDS